jgi:hypothetical protein
MENRKEEKPGSPGTKVEDPKNSNGEPIFSFLFSIFVFHGLLP